MHANRFIWLMYYQPVAGVVKNKIIIRLLSIAPTTLGIGTGIVPIPSPTSTTTISLMTTRTTVLVHANQSIRYRL